jgi:pyridoxamine 5'-phosphate oxidase
VEADRLAALRREYRRSGLSESHVAADPFAQFAAWLVDAVAVELTEPNAMVVTTVNADGEPSARHVLLKSYDSRGFVFYTNFGSRKATDLAGNPATCLLFPWHPMHRQVIVYGGARPVPRAEAAAYFGTRPRGAQLSAWASRQSSVITSRAELERRWAEMERRFPVDVPLPEFWGGFRVEPTAVEFWQGREDRLHDRLRYRRTDDGWLLERLAP